ncbi:MAG: HD domain-containing protein [Clostridiaceae bacterium]|nr:HD domain-containing protein [Clostridiaceae bacterium]
MTLEEMKEKLKRDLDTERYMHSINVMNTAVELAGYYAVDKRKAEIAGILHDCARGLSREGIFSTCIIAGIKVDEINKRQPKLLHGPVGAYLARVDYGIGDEEVLEAIKVHTTGKENMGMLDKIIFLADIIEPERDFQGVDRIREMAYMDIDRALMLAFDRIITHVLEKRELLHPDTINARNYILMYYTRP